MKTATLDYVLFKIPKSNEALELHLQHIHQSLKSDGQVICAFMTKYFNANMIEIAGKYFEEVTQSKAQKKARLMVLRNKKEVDAIAENLNVISYKDQNIKQYPGVFSSEKIDYATAFLLYNLTIPTLTENVLDFACGNGIL